MTERTPMRLTSPAEPVLLASLKALAYLAAITAYLIFFTSQAALWSSLGAGMVALLLVMFTEARLSTLGVFGLTFAPMGLGLAVSVTLGALTWVSDFIGPATVLRLTDSVFFGSLTFGIVFGLRAWGRRRRVGVWFEGSFIALSAIQLFAAHRNYQLHEPRFFSDWVIINGTTSIQWWLTLIGVGVALISALMMMRVRRASHFIAALVTLALVMGGIYYFERGTHKLPAVKPLQLAGGGGGGSKDGEGEGDGSGGGDGESDQNDPSNRPPDPVAVAVFHNDYEAQYNVLYFRQQVLSSFDGVKLVADTTGRFDQDVLTVFPHDQPKVAEATQDHASHLEITTSMYLINPHPTPPALTHAVKLEPLENPSPQRFVSAYLVRSLAPAVNVLRYSGRDSIPSSWSEEKRAFYLATHDRDPRYETLAEEITRELPPHRFSDTIYRAYAIKRYLEQEGYYTLKVKHRSSTDPAASFLFGEMRGYCVHFAHSAVHLLRSQGIAARVALGYAVDARTRSNSSAVLITGDRAHAWPEIHVEGVGWVTFDIYPQHSDEPPPRTVSQSLESLFGEMARDQLERGVKRSEPFPWALLGTYILYVALGLFALGHFIGFWRLGRARFGAPEERGRLAFIATLDRLAGAGLTRRYGESREAFARRLEARVPGLVTLTEARARGALGHPERRAEQSEVTRRHAAEVRRAFARHHRFRWLCSLLNPTGWIYSR